MKTDIEIIDDIYNYIKDSALDKAVTGRLTKGVRPPLSDRGMAYKPTGKRARATGISATLATTKTGTEDITIGVLSNSNGQIQQAIVNVNIYVSDLVRETWYEKDTIRLRELSRLAADLLAIHYEHGYRWELDSQVVLALPESREHVINNQLIYKQANN